MIPVAVLLNTVQDGKKSVLGFSALNSLPNLLNLFLIKNESEMNSVIFPQFFGGKLNSVVIIFINEKASDT